MSKPSLIVNLPCGCVADFSSMDEVVECPWCDATFFYDELVEWYQDSLLPPFFSYSAPKPLLWMNDDVGEVTRFCRCGCGSPFVRTGGTVTMISPVNLHWARN